MNPLKNKIFGKIDATQPYGYRWEKYCTNELAFDIQVGHHAPTIEQLIERGWMLRVIPTIDPYTHKLIPNSWSDDGVEITQNSVALTQEEINAKILAEKESKVNTFTENIQSHIDNKAWEIGQYGNHGMGDINSCSKYLGYDNPFRAECESLVAWCSACWIVALQILEDVELGIRPEPTLEEVISELPIYGV